jgi:hypothetical protein
LALPAVPPTAPPGHGDSLLKRVWNSQKNVLLVVVIVLLALLFAPKLARISRLATIDGRLSLLGKLVAAGIGGGAYKLTLAVT